MHPLYSKANSLTHDVISAAIEVQNHFGTGLLESIYVKCLARELSLRGYKTAREKPVSISYKGLEFSEKLFVDLLVEDCLVIEAKAVVPGAGDIGVFRAQTLSYLKLLDLPLGLIINFHNPRLGKAGVRRVILKGADK
ncbi:MAG: GxxExxY protein [Kiritimatiellae bacterium]|nr:GxxExxY protein [Kiritimatiellia bacterium]